MIWQTRFGDLPSGGWAAMLEAARLIPIIRPGQSEPAAVLVAGLNPHKRLDRDYQAFLDLVATQIGAALADAQAYEEERRRADALAEIDRAKTAFFSNVSHEFRTPLTLLLGPLEDALGDPALARRTARAARNRSPERHAAAPAGQHAARLLAGRGRAAPGELRADRSGALTASWSAFPLGLRESRTALVVDATPLPRAGPCRSGDVGEDRSQPAVQRLQIHLRRRDPGLPRCERRRRESRCCAVADTGTGIPEAELPRLFERFHRIEGARGRTHEGTGIGLALVQELVRLHGGSIEAASTQGRGSTFTVRIPLGTSHLPPDRIGGARAAPRAAARAPGLCRRSLALAARCRRDAAPDAADQTVFRAGRAARGGPARVLVADDNADMRDYLARLLRRRYDVTAVGDGAAALAAVEKAPPELVLTDVMMPVLDGFELLARAARRPGTRGIPVILLSARAGEEARVEGLRTGADDYLVKPFSARELLARVAGLIELARGRAQTASILRDEAHRLEILNRTAGVLAAEIDLEPLVQSVTDAATELTGAAFGAFFYNVADDSGESYLLYTLSGASREAFADFPMPRNTAVFAPTFGGEGVVRSGDIRNDPRYGQNAPNQGPPPGHLPVVSYLAVPVAPAPGG